MEWSLWLRITTILGLIASVLTILNALGLISFGEKKDLRTTVISQNQSGGQTAAKIVNLHRTPPRQLNSQQKEELLTILNPYKNRTIRVSFAMSNPEAQNYAQEIYNFLKSSGFSMPPRLSQSPLNFIGIQVDTKKDANSVLIRVGHNID